jgi:predicted PurR-regulated permease PerM
MKFFELENSTKIILKVIFAGLALAFLWVIRDIIAILLVAVIFASAMEPMVDYFKAHRVPRAVSVLTVYVLVLGIAGLIIYLIIPPFINEFKSLQDTLPVYSEQFATQFSGGLFGDVSLGQFLQNIFEQIGSKGLVSQTFGIFSGLLSIFPVLVISFYLVAEEEGMKKFIKTLIPPHHQSFTLGLIEKIQTKMGHWILGQVILSFSIFAATFIGLTLLGVKYALFLALLAGLLELVPYIGPFLSALPALFFAFFQDPTLALWVLILYLVVQKLENYILVPKVMEKTVGTSPLVVLLALLVGFKLAGILGLLIAVPVVSALNVIITEFTEAKA